jgi:hypothetical protein
VAGYRDKPIQMEEYARLWGQVNGKSVSYRSYSEKEAVDSGFPDVSILFDILLSNTWLNPP